ncbi:MAG: tripartite tricarboxylate transporter substrate binding protein [Betaproteobacteria bacterium]|nr:tripartite tricarboxylate transporter substrate binding protein [Betaproteobacteria bacterium]
MAIQQRRTGGSMRNSRRITFAIVVAAGVAVAALPGLAQAQQEFPTKPIRLLVGYAPGSQPDTLARMIGQKASESWKQPMVIDNRAGAGGTLAAATVAKAAPDGHTILLAGSNFVISAALQPTLPYDPIKDFAGITQIGFGTGVLVVAPALGVKSAKDLIALAKAQPGKIVFASGAVGASNHLSGARFSLAAGIKVVTVAFKGAPEATIEVLAGRAHYSIVTPVVALPFIKDGKLLALAVTTPQRSPVLPDAPALAETLPDFKRPEASLGLLAPAKTPRPILNQISREVARVLALPDVKDRLQAMGFASAPSTPEQYEKILREQIETLSKLVKDAGLRTR